jgi:hypothetical protein
MPDYIVVVPAAAIAAALGWWLASVASRRWRLKVPAALGVAALSVLALAGAYLSGIGIAFSLLEGRTATSPAPAWASWLVGALMLAGVAVLAFGLSALGISAWRSISARRSRS